MPPRPDYFPLHVFTLLSLCFIYHIISFGSSSSLYVALSRDRLCGCTHVTNSIFVHWKCSLPYQFLWFMSCSSIEESENEALDRHVAKAKVELLGY